MGILTLKEMTSFLDGKIREVRNLFYKIRLSLLETTLLLDASLTRVHS